MPKAYPMEFRIAVANAYDECGSSAEVAEMMGCCEAWVRRLIQNRRERGTLEPKPAKTPDTSKLDEQDLATLRSIIEKTPDLTLAELAVELQKQAGKKAGVTTIWRATQKLKLPLKKKRFTPPSRTART
jgi:transposase